MKIEWMILNIGFATIPATFYSIDSYDGSYAVVHSSDNLGNPALHLALIQMVKWGTRTK